MSKHRSLLVGITRFLGLETGVERSSHWIITELAIAALGQGQEPEVSRDEPRQGRLLMKVWVYVNDRYPVGDPDHLQIFADLDTAIAWFEQHDPEGVAFQYPVKPESGSLSCDGRV
jgi:hypothetical protein